MEDDYDDIFLDRLLARDAEAFRVFFRRYAPDVMRVCLRVLRNRQDAEDVLSEVFLEIWNRFEQYDSDRGTLKAYISMIARSRAIDRLRSLSRSPSTLLSLAATPDDDHPISTEHVAALEEIESQDQAVNALQRLDASHRQVLELAFFEGLSHSQISSQLDVPLGTVKSIIRRGLAKLQTIVRAKRSGGSEP